MLEEQLFQIIFFSCFFLCLGVFELQSLTEDVMRQTEREKQLQTKFNELQTDLRSLDPTNELLTN